MHGDGVLCLFEGLGCISARPDAEELEHHSTRFLDASPSPFDETKMEAQHLVAIVRAKQPAVCTLPEVVRQNITRHARSSHSFSTSRTIWVLVNDT